MQKEGCKSSESFSSAQIAFVCAFYYLHLGGSDVAESPSTRALLRIRLTKRSSASYFIGHLISSWYTLYHKSTATNHSSTYCSTDSFWCRGTLQCSKFFYYHFPQRKTFNEVKLYCIEVVLLANPEMKKQLRLVSSMPTKMGAQALEDPLVAHYSETSLSISSRPASQFGIFRCLPRCCCCIIYQLLVCSDRRRRQEHKCDKSFLPSAYESVKKMVFIVWRRRMKHMSSRGLDLSKGKCRRYLSSTGCF